MLFLFEEKYETRIFGTGALRVLKDAINLFISSPEESIHESVSVIREQRRCQGEGRVSYRLIGSTLLPKGLECGHALILDAGNMGTSDSYVVFSREAESVTAFSVRDESTL